MASRAAPPEDWGLSAPTTPPHGLHQCSKVQPEQHTKAENELLRNTMTYKENLKEILDDKS